jgi:hypothetical protein|tara:strand:- start:401 stop:625 length:225 start_codon:yes stop_codon:yes gene_type:complete
MKDSWVEEHRLRNEEEFGDYLDSLCEGIKGHPFVGDRLLDWRYDEDDLVKLMLWMDWEDASDDPENKVIYVPFH